MVSAKGTAGWVCHVCITRHWFFCRDLALQPFILCFAVGPNGFEKFCYSPVTPEAKVRIDFTCTGLHHLSRAWAVRAKAKWNAIHTQALRQALLSARRMAGLLRGCSWERPAASITMLFGDKGETDPGRPLMEASFCVIDMGTQKSFLWQKWVCCHSTLKTASLLHLQSNAGQACMKLRWETKLKH